MPGFDRTRIVDMSDKDLDEFTCGICQDIFIDPVVTQCCRQIYCKECISEWLKERSTCPNDRKQLLCNNLIPPSRLVINLLNNIKVKCDYHSNGCQIVTTIEKLGQHLKNCSHNPKKICKICSMNSGTEGDHNCIAGLLIRNSCLIEENQTLKKQNKELKAHFNNGITSMMTQVIESARDYIYDCTIEQEHRMSDQDVETCIEHSRNAILESNSFSQISSHLSEFLNRVYLLKRWHILTFTADAAESSVSTEEFLRLRFNRLIIEFFTTNK